jgi:hypothetical protein
MSSVLDLEVCTLTEDLLQESAIAAPRTRSPVAMSVQYILHRYLEAAVQFLSTENLLHVKAIHYRDAPMLQPVVQTFL